MKVFVCHCTADRDLISGISDQLRAAGFETLYAEDVVPEKHPQHISEKVQSLIDQSDVVAAFITKDSIAHAWVHQEIGYALRSKPLIPLVEEGINGSELAFLEGAEYVPLYRDDLNRTLAKFLEWMANLKAGLAKSLQKDDVSVLKILGVIFICAVFIWLLTKK